MKILKKYGVSAVPEYEKLKQSLNYGNKFQRIATWCRKIQILLKSFEKKVGTDQLRSRPNFSSYGADHHH